MNKYSFIAGSVIIIVGICTWSFPINKDYGWLLIIIGVLCLK